MSSRSHFGEDLPIESSSHEINPSTLLVPPYKHSHHPYSSIHWSNSLQGKRVLSRRRKYLTFLSCAFLVAIVFGGYFCRLKVRNGNRAALTTRRLAGAGDGGEEELRELEEALASSLCRFIDTSSDSASSDPSVSADSVETQTTGRGRRKRRESEHSQQPTQPPGSGRLFEEYWSDLFFDPGELRLPPSQDRGDRDEDHKQLAKRARIEEWGNDPVADLDLLLNTPQSLPQGGFFGSGPQLPSTLGSDSLLSTVTFSQPVSVPTPGAYPTPHQQPNPFEVLWGSFGSGYIPQDTRERLPTYGERSNVEPHSTRYSSPAATGNILPQVTSGNIQEADSTVDDSWLQGYENNPLVRHSLSGQPQQPRQSPDNEAGPAYPSTASSSGYPLQETAGSSGHQLHADTVEQELQSVVDMTNWESEEIPFASATDEELQKHPQYRVPSLMPDVRVAHFPWRRALRTLTVTRQMPLKLLKFQKVIRKGELSQQDVGIILDLTWEFLKFSASTGKQALVKRSVCELIGPYAIRFLIVDALWIACEILGKAAEKEFWWGKVIKDLTAPPVLLLAPKTAMFTRYEPLMSRIRVAFSVFQKGDRPAARDLLTIKKMIFGPPPIHPVFGGVVWDFWRRDLGSS